MPGPTQITPAYNNRPILAMLDQSRFHEISRPLLECGPSWSPKIIVAAVGLAILFAVGVFLLLYHYDRSAALSPDRVAAVARAADLKGNAGSLSREQTS